MMVLVEMMVWMMMMIIPMKPSLMTVLMAMISPLREGISPADFSLSESFCRRGEQTDAMGWLKLGPNVR